jgi:hypothetical protein
MQGILANYSFLRRNFNQAASLFIGLASLWQFPHLKVTACELFAAPLLIKLFSQLP